MENQILANSKQKLKVKILQTNKSKVPCLCFRTLWRFKNLFH
jgi:hypothetical protein